MRTIKTASISEHLKHDAGKVTLRMDRETADVLYKAAQMYSNILSGNLDPVSISVRMNKSGLSCSQVDLANQKTAEKFLQSAKTTLFPELSGTGRHAHTYTTESTLRCHAGCDRSAMWQGVQERTTGHRQLHIGSKFQSVGSEKCSSQNQNL